MLVGRGKSLPDVGDFVGGSVAVVVVVVADVK